ncbi:hypothetical protein RHS04_00827 [Rhizoctonia solani]|uniref:VWFA domain-containing protein n=1 Tax=Rhizoctonia solani TaxID=456999 RepID=A0A8H7HDW9_9AGAM|nr:hypothetical protein RHS04_00827 [Rhizoctonia solani]
MASESSHQNPQSLFSGTQLRDPGLETLMPQHTIDPTPPVQASGTGPRDSHLTPAQPGYISHELSSGHDCNTGPTGPSSNRNTNFEIPATGNPRDVSAQSDGDTEMLDANSHFDENTSPTHHHYEGPSHISLPEDVLGAVPNLFRLLDLVDEHGSGGIVEKVVIDQQSLHRLLNIIQPGSYDSVSKINFRTLDQLSIKPTGVYGSQPEIVEFLRQARLLDQNSANILSRSDTRDDLSSGLGSGLYLVLDPEHHDKGPSKATCIIYWPEDTTWDDQAASSSVRRNRVTFMRYLNKLADQIICLVSSSQARALVWDTSAHNKDLPEDQQENDDDARLFDFEVSKSLEQEEGAVGSPGFTAAIESRILPSTNDRQTSRVRLVPGEQKTALLVVRNEKEQPEEDRFDSNVSTMNLKKMVESKECPIQLGSIEAADLEVLAANGLRSQHKSIFAKYDQCLRELKAERLRAENADRRHIDDHINRDGPKLKAEIQHLVRSSYDGVYPSLALGFDMSHGPEETALLYQRYPDLRKISSEIERKNKLDIVQDREFQFLKGKWPFLKKYLEENSKLSRHEQEDFINDLLNGAVASETHPRTSTQTPSKRFSMNPVNYIPNPTSWTIGWNPSNWNSGGWGSSWGSGNRSQGNRDDPSVAPMNTRSNSGFARGKNGGISDPEFFSQLDSMTQKYPSLSVFKQKVQERLGHNLEALEKKVLGERLDGIISMERQRQSRNGSDARDSIYREEAHRAFEVAVRELREVMSSNSRQVRRVDWIKSIGGQAHGHHYTNSAQYRWGGSVCSTRPAQNRHIIYPLELTEQDSQLCRVDESHVPQPKMDTRHRFEFTLPKGRSVEFIQFVRDKCLVVVSERIRTRIFIEDNVTIQHAVNSTHGKVSLSHDSLGGSECKFAFDQTTRLLAIVHGLKEDLKLSIYIFDELFANLRSRGSPISLRSWYSNKPIDLSKACFVTGVEEICLVETSGRMRIFSLVTQQFRTASLQIERPIIDAFSAPDGSCLLVVVPSDGSLHQLLAFHWASFGTNKRGIESAILTSCEGYRVATRFDGRGRIHVVSFDAMSKAITSTILQITQKATEFSFRSDREHSRKKATDTINNSLIDCHLEVWTRFPVVPAVARNTLTAIDRQPRQLIFSSPVELQGVEEYFARMVSTFETTTRKPMGSALTAIQVKRTDTIGRNTAGQISEFKLGSFIVELLCLIPLHLAVTRENRFIPLKDGVWDPVYERSLLGADVPTIVDTLSLGWYESLLQSYMATKPVRVVSSMGEQSVGKSYCLNHFADTSFAGSAMRTTEGVWLSCTPTEDYLLVSLDFEGVHSIERSAQEDALLVLFNTAISNLVLFRNNFAMSRDIAGLFTSFQSSATVLDPNVNRGLFNSTLAIIIKDVTNADSKDIVREFSLKFQGIVEKERDQNFITRLHRGRIQIIPWPVINSPNFYTLFSRLHQRLDQQPFTHGGGGAFLHNLKTLMAKIKTSDWGSMDQNVAAHRAQQLIERLPNALSFGRHEEGPLKNMDADAELETPEFMPSLFVPEFATGNDAESEALAEQSLRALVQACEQIIHTRHQVPDTMFIEGLQTSIYEALDHRLTLVRNWVNVNIERFPQGNQDIRNLTNKLDAASLGMRNAVRHSGEHSCGTNHQCVLDCEVAEEHSQREPCGLPAGHGGRHMCDVKTHSCGMECHLSGKGGCAQSCIKIMTGIMCALLGHTSVGSPAISEMRGKGTTEWCLVAPGHAPHPGMNHTNAMLVITPALVLSNAPYADVCAVIRIISTDWLLCEEDGICQIETRPSAIQEQFSGRHESFMYTRFTQVARQLSCVIPIPPGELSHDGVHVHDTGDNPFHYCDARCPNCEYVCGLPFGHGQQLHDTSHGSMITTQWVLQSDKDDVDPVYELQGRKFGSGDEGAPMLCNLVCAAQGRHAHIDHCRDPGNCSNTDCEHIAERMHPDPNREKDWISHATFWARSDPYPQDEQNEFSKCDVLCAGPEHEASATAQANPSYCILPIFHAPEAQQPAPPTGHVSIDGHAFDCQNPSRMNQAYHILFVIDSSGSMYGGDRRPLPDTPISTRLISESNNRYGAVLSALHGFWLSREVVACSTATQARQDAYSVITFASSATTRVQNDFMSTTDQLISHLLPQRSGGTNFHAALKEAQSLIENHWSSDRSPVIIFLSDGECNIGDNAVYDLCHLCVRLGKALAFHSVSFGQDRCSASLRRMADIAHEVYASAPQDVLSAARGNPCAYTNAIDTIQLADTFLGIASSLQKPRASLMNQHGSGGR